MVFFTRSEHYSVQPYTSLTENPGGAPVGIEEIFWSLLAGAKSRGGHLDKTAVLVLSFQLGCSVYPSWATDCGRVSGERSVQPDG